MLAPLRATGRHVSFSRKRSEVDGRACLSTLRRGAARLSGGGDAIAPEHLRDAQRVTVRYRKYPDALHWRHEMVRLGEDEHGVWLGTTGGSYEKPDRAVAIEHPFVHLVAPDAWWTLLHNGPEHVLTHYVDIVSPARWIDDANVEMLDLDLDVVLTRDGGVEVLDDDEFAVHQVLFDYPPELIDGARRATGDVVRAIQAGAEPFATRAAAWRAHLLGEGPVPS